MVPPGLGALRLLLSLVSTRISSAQLVDSLNRPARPRERGVTRIRRRLRVSVNTYGGDGGPGTLAIDWVGRYLPFPSSKF
jgi:hypothetical protein